jgi:amino acid adenylation domain-containing protein
MVKHYGKVIEEIVRDAGRRISEIELMGEVEKRQVVEEWNETGREYGETRFVHELIAEQARRNGEAIAVKSEEGDLSYGELNRRANQLAHYLKGLKVGPEDRVGICAERSPEMVVAILGALKAGAAFVPVDPSDPKRRIAFTFEDGKVKVLLTQERLLDRIEAQDQVVICLDKDWDRIGRDSGEDVGNGVSGEGLAYVIYTSGSTGRPKGVMNTHHGIRNRLLWMQEKYWLNETDRVLQKTASSFDVSVWEFLWPLMAGAALVMARPGGHKDSEYLLRVIKEEEITTIHFVPSMLKVFLEERVEEAASLRRVLCSGEALTKDLERRSRSRMRAQLSNLYGPTEAAIDVTCWVSEGADEMQVVPIGKPIANVQMYILDRELDPVPVAVKGALYISGAGLARGYLGRPELTAEKFIPNRFSRKVGERLYRTGDLARYLSDGNIEFLGRSDDQVKIRGYRIELGEIEAALLRHEAVREAAVLARGVEDKRLIAYLVSRHEERVPVSELREYLKQSLPEYMAPSGYVWLEKMPTTSSGKLDRKALPESDEAEIARGRQYVAPRWPVEETLASIWSEVLEIDKIGINDNFFELGGHSLLLTQLVSRIRHTFRVDLPLRALFDTPTIMEMSEAILTRQVSQTDEAKVEEMLDRLNRLSPEEIKMLLEADGGKYLGSRSGL